MGKAIFFILVWLSIIPFAACQLPPIQIGVGSYYGPEFKGRKTACGEIFNPDSLTAAHKTLPFGSLIKVKLLENGDTVIVRVNDRGPFVKGRIVDLSTRAAIQIGLKNRGLAKVSVEVIRLGYPVNEAPPPVPEVKRIPINIGWVIPFSPQIFFPFFPPQRVIGEIHKPSDTSQ